MKQKKDSANTQTQLFSTIMWRGKSCFLGKLHLGWIQTVENDRVFVTPRKRKQHFFRIFHGWGINKDLILELQTFGIPEVWIQVTEESGQKRCLRTELKNYTQHAINHINESEPYDEQLILDERYFTETQQ